MAMVTRGTVKTHVARILMKLDLTTDVTGSLLTSLVTRAGKPMQRVAPHNAIRRRQYSRRICTVIGGSGLHPPEKSWCRRFDSGPRHFAGLRRIARAHPRGQAVRSTVLTSRAHPRGRARRGSSEGFALALARRCRPPCGHNEQMHAHECDCCGCVEHTDTPLPPVGWVRRGGRRLAGGSGRWLLVLCETCECRAGLDGPGAAGLRSSSG
jgi:hypothetical protein